MKSAQWTTVLILALMVGGISFVSVYLGGSREPGSVSEGETLASLTFPYKIFPREGDKPQTTEIRHQGHQDYWFANESGQEVIVGLNEKGCTCSEVELTVAPPSWLPYLARSVLEKLPQPANGLDNLAILAAASEREQQFPELPDSASGTVLTKENSVRVPAGAIGRVRLSWRREAKKQNAFADLLNTYADLWMGERGSSVSARLEAHVSIVAPMDVDKEVAMPAINESDLKAMSAGQRVEVYCWSLTRPAFSLKAKLLHERLKAESDPVEVGEPVPLSAEEMRRLESRETLQGLTVHSGYRIPVIMRAKAKDGTPMEWGYFSRTVQLSSTDDIEPVQVKVTGAVLGDIMVGEGKGAGMINLGPFDRQKGVLGNKANNHIVLHTDEENVELELDRTRVPEYLKPSLSEPQKASTGHRSWVLRVEVPPNAVRGEFPRADNPVYRDSAIYVKTKTGNSAKPQRSIRIPVLGVAN